jgi:hypothetical protein
MAKLDKIFISTEWEKATVRVASLEKSISDHTPLLIESGDNCFAIKKKSDFEKWWLERPEFKEIVAKAWANNGLG